MYKTKNLTLLATLLAFFLTPVLFAQQASSEGSRTAAGNPVSVSLPSFNASPGTTVAVPVTVGDLTGRNAISFDFEVRFDPAVLRPVAAAPTSNAGTLSSSFVITANPNLSGRLLVSGFNAYPLSGQGTLLKLNFEVVGQSGTTTPLTWQSFMFNEGDPPVTLSSGGTTVGSGPVAVTLPALSASPGMTVAVPVTVGDLTGRNAISFDFEVRFDPAVLRPVAAAPTSNAGTLSSSFVITANPNLSGRLLVSGFNAYPLSGQGTLLNLNFEVVGQSGATPLTWQSFMFNEGNPASTAAAGQFTVAAARALKSAYDFDGDGRTDLGVFRPTDRFWYMFRTSAGFAASPFGLSTDRIVPADYDGDGKTDLGIFRDGQWFWLNSSTGTYSFVTFGLAGDTPVPADYTGDGKADPAIFRGGVWYILNAASGQSSIVSFGLATDKPVVGDFDNDGKADQAVFRNGQWLINRSCLGPTTAQFGQTNDRPVAGDFDGDGKADLGVFRNGVWYLMRSTQGLFALQFGIATDTPIAADYDGDGKTDIAVFRNGVWYQFRSLKGFASIQFGVSTDKPVPAAYQQ